VRVIANAQSCERNNQPLLFDVCKRDGEMQGTVLVVEDTADLRNLLKFSLELSGFTALLAVDASEARHQLHTLRPDVVILDWMLPGESGIALLRWIRSHKAMQNLPIIVLTARTDDSDRSYAIEAGANAYITKPFSPRDLVAAAQTLIGA
jgi:two-component system, OmpR family, phosphate regulon response regulator PhoB